METNLVDNEHIEEDDYLLVRDTDRRNIRPPIRYGFSAHMFTYAFNTTKDKINEEPKAFAEGISSKDRQSWLLAMTEELDSLEKNSTLSLVAKPEKTKIIGSKWIFKRKEGILGVELSRFKARLVAKGSTKMEGIDYDKIFSPVVKHSSIRVLLSMVARSNMEFEQMDVKTTFLHEDLHETIYVQQPTGFEVEGKKN